MKTIAPYACPYCGAPAWTDPKDIPRPADICYMDDHGWPTTRQLLTAVLIYIKKNGPVCRGVGLCGNIEDALEDTYSYHSGSAQLLMADIAKKWPKYSGDEQYPVPSPDPNESASSAYNRMDNMWDENTAYGQLRWEMLDFCLAELQDKPE